MSSNKPLEGIRVIELSTYVAAPTSGRILGDWGADVIKVEAVKGDVWRFYGTNFGCPITDEENPTFDICNSNKRFIALNLKDSKGMEILHKLLAEADVFLTNNRLAPLEKMGLDYETLKERYPRLIYALLTGHGEKGPDAAKPGFDIVTYWAKGGFMADLCVDNPGSYPIYSPAGVADISAGSLLFGGICAALFNREKTGRGDKVSLSLFGTAVWTMGYMNMITQKKYNYPYPKKRYEGKPTAIPYQCADGEWMMISVLEYDRYIRDLCAVLGIPELANDPRFATEQNMMKPENRAAMVKSFEERFKTKTSVEWDRLLSNMDIVHDRLAHFREITENEQAKVNHYIDEITFANGTKAWMPRPCVCSENVGVPEYKLSRGVGADTTSVLKEIGYSEPEIYQLNKDQVIKAV
jgi:crotonobetainyl-CoA:carnitine CoA-transferase CaiB-like acyl-CoA transferase